MKFKDYYAILGVERDASADVIKKAYRKLAHRHHPDVAGHADAEEQFKEIAEAYATLKDPEKRAAYDQLGAHTAGADFRPPPDWEQQFSGGGGTFDDIDLSDLFASFGMGARGSRRDMPIPGRDYSAATELSVEQVYHGAEIELQLAMPDYDDSGMLHNVPHTLKVRIPKGATDGQRLRLRGKGGRGLNGGPDGDLYLTINLRPHRLFRPSGHDLYLDLPLAPWEAALGTSIEVPTPAGTVRLKVRPGTAAGQQLRLGGRGLPKPGGGHGDLLAIVQIAMPSTLSAAERELLTQLAALSDFNPRRHFQGEHEHAD